MVLAGLASSTGVVHAQPAAAAESSADGAAAPLPAPAGAPAPPPRLDWTRGRFEFHASPWRSLTIEDETGTFRFHSGGVLTLDIYGYDGRNARDSGGFVDRALLRFDGVAGPWSWRLAPDLRGIDTRGGFDEAWVALSPLDRLLRVTAGLQELSRGIEHSIPEEDLPLVGYAFPAYLDDRSDLALRVDGEFADGVFSYDAAVTAGEGFTLLGERVSGSQMSVRAVTYPFRKLPYTYEIPHTPYELPLLSGLFFSLAFSHTEHFRGPLEVANPLRNSIFVVDDFKARQSDFWTIGYGIDLGPFHVHHEFVRGGYRGVRTPGGNRETLDDQVTAWSLLFAWMLTGEHYDSRPYRQRGGQSRLHPNDPLWTEAGLTGTGAWELAFRYSNADIDRDFFLLGFTDFTTSSQEFRAASVAVNWYAMRSLRASFQVVRTIADQRPAAFDSHGRDTSVVFRLQYTF